ncbi:MAG TPA: DUF2250 domain-containing protein [Acidobacteriota bacterium]|nr:DUF2250 domain-containing protein [Acidobacteriota bacterium]
MADRISLKEHYILARCCSPATGDDITGYHSHGESLKVHRRDCPNLRKTEPSRLVTLAWEDILEPEVPPPGEDYDQLDALDIAVLKHHRDCGIDYSLVVARSVGTDKQTAFDRHRKLRSMGLLCRVEAVMVQYRKGITDNKWIKHRNHTYYELTGKGHRYLDYSLSQDQA